MARADIFGFAVPLRVVVSTKDVRRRQRYGVREDRSSNKRS